MGIKHTSILEMRVELTFGLSPVKLILNKKGDIWQ